MEPPPGKQGKRIKSRNICRFSSSFLRPLCHHPLLLLSKSSNRKFPRDRTIHLQLLIGASAPCCHRLCFSDIRTAAVRIHQNLLLRVEIAPLPRRLVPLGPARRAGLRYGTNAVPRAEALTGRCLLRRRRPGPSATGSECVVVVGGVGGGEVSVPLASLIFLHLDAEEGLMVMLLFSRNKKEDLTAIFSLPAKVKEENESGDDGEDDDGDDDDDEEDDEDIGDGGWWRRPRERPCCRRSRCLSARSGKGRNMSWGLLAAVSSAKRASLPGCTWR